VQAMGSLDLASYAPAVIKGNLRMSYIEKLIEHGTNFKVKRGPGIASFGPVSSSDSDIDAFQGVVEELRRNEGDGYSIHLDHPMSDRGGAFIDLVLVVVDAE